MTARIAPHGLPVRRALVLQRRPQRPQHCSCSHLSSAAHRYDLAPSNKFLNMENRSACSVPSSCAHELSRAQQAQAAARRSLAPRARAPVSDAA